MDKYYNNIVGDQVLQLFNIQIHHIKSTGLGERDAIDSHESGLNFTTAIGRYWICKRIGYDLNLHSWLDADTVGILHHLCGNNKAWHSYNYQF